MKQVLLLVALTTMSTCAMAQTNAKTITSIRPDDGTPAYFTTQEELDAKKADKIEKIKVLIIEANGDVEKQTALRKELWRMENATVIKVTPNKQ